MSQAPLFLDLIGTCHSDSTKPAILRPQHLTWYRTHLVRGLALYPPDILGLMLNEKKLEQDTDGALMIRTEVRRAPLGTGGGMPSRAGAPFSSNPWAVLRPQSAVG